MRSKDLVRLAWRNLLRRKSRTFLTILSVTIGIVSIVMMVSIGLGLEQQQKIQAESLGSLTLLEVYSSAYRDENDRSPLPTKGIITDKTLQEIRNMDGVKAAFATETLNGQISLGKKGLEMWQQPEALDLTQLPEPLELQDGTKLTQLKKGEFVVGPEPSVMKLSGGNAMMMEPVPDFDWSKSKTALTVGNADPSAAYLGGSKTFEKIPLKFRGMLKHNDYLRDSGFYTSLETKKLVEDAEKKIAQGQSEDGSTASISTSGKSRKTKIYQSIKVKVETMDDVERVGSEIRETYGLEHYSSMDFINASKAAMRNIQMALAGIGSVALLVSAIGITNTMMMSIQERTREIGVMKVIGARVQDIRRMFLSEAICIAAIGGLFGILISMGLSAVLNSIVAVPSVDGTTPSTALSLITWWLAIGAVLFAAVIGLMAGYFPARRATRLSAIDAIRTN